MQIVAVARFLIFQMQILRNFYEMTAKAMCLRINVAQLNIPLVGKLPEYCNTWKCYILF